MVLFFSPILAHFQKVPINLQCRKNSFSNQSWKWKIVISMEVVSDTVVKASFNMTVRITYGFKSQLCHTSLWMWHLFTGLTISSFLEYIVSSILCIEGYVVCACLCMIVTFSFTINKCACACNTLSLVRDKALSKNVESCSCRLLQADQLLFRERMIKVPWPNE